MDIVLRANLLRFVFFVKRKSAYEMRLSDWSSGVCSSELLNPPLAQPSSNCDISRSFVGFCRTMPLLPALLRRQVRLGGQYQPQTRRERRPEQHENGQPADRRHQAIGPEDRHAGRKSDL